jgi:hypothetical protein
MIPGKILDEFISWFDMKQQALASPLTPPSTTPDNDSTFIYAPAISYIEKDIQSCADHYTGTIDDPSGKQTSKVLTGYGTMSLKYMGGHLPKNGIFSILN